MVEWIRRYVLMTDEEREAEDARDEEARRARLERVQEQQLAKLVSTLSKITTKRDDARMRATKARALARVAKQRNDDERARLALTTAVELDRDAHEAERLAASMREQVRAWQQRHNMASVLSMTQVVHNAAKALGLPLTLDNDRMQDLMADETEVNVGVREISSAYDTMGAELRRAEDEAIDEGGGVAKARASAVDREMERLAQDLDAQETERLSARLAGVTVSSRRTATATDAAEQAALPSYADALAALHSSEAGAGDDAEALAFERAMREISGGSTAAAAAAVSARPAARASRAAAAPDSALFDGI